MELDYIKIFTKNGSCMYGGNQSLFDVKVKKSGCGMIAACDVILFLSGRNTVPIPLCEYEKFVGKIRQEIAYRKTSNPFGIFPQRVVKILNKYVNEHEFVFRSRLSLNYEKLKNYIHETLKQGIPVIVRIGENEKKLPFKISYPATGNRAGEGRMRWHYITVTGISEKGVLTFSSWGGKGTMSCMDLYRHFGFTGGIIIPKAKQR